jgi:hypothetical protein
MYTVDNGTGKLGYPGMRPMTPECVFWTGPILVKKAIRGRHVLSDAELKKMYGDPPIY